MTTMLAPQEAPPSRVKVNDLEVIEVEFAETPLSTPDRPVRFKQIVKILLEDGSVTYGCAWAGCGFTGKTAIAVRPHLKAHKPAANAVDVTSLPVGEVLELARSAQTLRTDLERTTRERDRLSTSLYDEWKPRALAAERQLNSIQKALAPVR
ncbi:hypothetical protein ACFY2H_31500 [Streptomyces griseofuscus]|uniref:hypothetical protein n=1 Tax=Streptomycetaceae TaxID=2062 RepID=UPI000690D139|nr:hypothetical protein [Actinacidiphila yeochonensis]